jgi:4-hydroxy-4-methyl-2-oxoglutarate aldolase
MNGDGGPDELASALAASAGAGSVRVVLGLEPAYPGARAVGPALTVQGSPGDNLALHHAIATAAAGEVIVLAVGGERHVAHCGEIVVRAARHRGVAGIVLDGAIRDREAIGRLGLPVFHQGTSPVGPGKHGPGALRVPVELDGVRIEPGDLVCADDDGVAVIPAAEVQAVRQAAADLERREHAILAAIDRGESTVAIYGFEALG